MTQEEKQLLLTDLCARLPYKVKATYSKHEETTIAGEYEILDAEGVEVIDGYLDDYCFRIDGYKIHISSIKPYLRPMSSMTTEEEVEYDATFDSIYINGHYDSCMSYKSFDFLNKKMFDYRGLIPMGLALEAKEGMYQD